MRLKTIASVLAGLLATATVSAAETPMITFKSNIFDTYGATNAFHFMIGTSQTCYIDVDCGYGPVETEVSPAYFDEDSQSMVGTAVSCTVKADGLVKIYGDPSLVDYFYAEGCYLDWIDLGECTNLEILELQHNELKYLDLSKYTNLQALYLTDNPFTPQTPLVVGQNHPNLMILELDIIEYLSPDFDITTYPNLVSFDGYHCETLTHLDPTKCPNLRRLSVDMTPISSLDLSKNANLEILNIEDTKITSIDLSKNPKLTQLYARNESGWLNKGFKLTELDLSNNSELTYLTANGNLLTEIDLSKNPKLNYAILSNNLLTSLDVSANTMLSTLDISKNNMTFATLPVPQNYYYEYNYKQNPLKSARVYGVGDVVDYSTSVLREGSTTDAVLYAHNIDADTVAALGPEYFSFADGKVTFLKEFTDSCYLSFGNTLFPDATLTTGKFMIKTAEAAGEPSPIVNFTTTLTAGKPVEFSVGLAGATPSAPRKFYVDFGDKELVEFTADSPQASIIPNVKGTRKGIGKLYVYVPEGEIMTAFSSNGLPYRTIDLTAATELQSLTLANGNLSSVNLAYNRCLNYLDLSGNNLANIDLSGVNGVYNKNILNTLDLSGNKLTTFTIHDTRMLTFVDLSNNLFEELPYKEWDNVVNFNVSNNQLTTLNLAYITGEANINASNNMLTTLTLPESQAWKSFDISGNCFTIATLPTVRPGFTRAAYTYAPQQPIELPSKGPGADLSAQNIIIDGMNTNYVWKLADGTPVSAEDITVNKGVAKFVNTELGDVYCEMTNGAFPQFTGDNALKTTLITTAGMPTNKLATFVTTADGTAELSFAAQKAGTGLYIDWNGDNTSLDQYLLATSYKLFQAKTYAGATVNVYTYDPAEKITVFSITNAKMSSMDASGLVDVTTFNVSGAGLSELVLPNSPNLAELLLDENNIENINIEGFPKLDVLNLNNNKLTSFDISGLQNLGLFNAANNQLQSVKFGNNPRLWQLSLANNDFSEFDISTLPSISQVSLSHNNISELDVANCSNLIQLLIDNNRFTFPTLPPVRPTYYQYVYYNQAPIEVENNEGVVDLSSQVRVGSTDTKYQWFIDVPEINELGEVSGEELYIDEEYTLNEGVTTFLKPFSNVMCVMTNSEFPNLYLYTPLMDITLGVNSATTGKSTAIALEGLNIHITTASEGQAALVDLDGREVTRAAISNGTVTLTAPAPGYYIVNTNEANYKVFVK